MGTGQNLGRLVLFRPQMRGTKVASRHIRKIVSEPLGSIQTRSLAIIDDNGPCPTPVRYAFRTLDRQWLIGDARLLNDVRPELWKGYSLKQIFLTALQSSSPGAGPAISFAGAVPDQDHFKGSFGGRVYPFWRDAAATIPNIKPALTVYLTKTYDRPVAPEDAMAYFAAIMAHPVFVARFVEDLRQPGLRLPLTADASLFAQAVTIGLEVVWLYTFGERFSDPANGRPLGPPRMPRGGGPTIPNEGTIPGAPAGGRMAGCGALGVDLPRPARARAA